MRRVALILAGLGVLALASTARADNPPKKVLLVTHSGGFIHDSVGVAEQILKEIGPKHGLEFTCYRYTGDPDADNGRALKAYNDKFRPRTGLPVAKENCGRVNAETLKKFDAVFFFTSGNPLTKDEVKDLTEWVKAGGAFAGTHCATDTLYTETPYGELVGAFFEAHPPGFQKVKLVVEDPKHAAAKSFLDKPEIEDEMYRFRETPYSRDRLHIILSVHPDSIGLLKGKRADKDYAVSWCQEVGKGRSFYTSLGHRKEVWKDPRFQEHVIAGLKWTLKLADGDATPSNKLKKSATKE